MLTSEAEKLPSRTLPTISKHLLHQLLSVNYDVAQPVQEGCGHDMQVDSKKLVPVLHALHLAGGSAQLQDIKVKLRFETGLYQSMHLLASQCMLGRFPKYNE